MSSGHKMAEELRRWLGPLGRYRPGLFRMDMTQGFHNCDRWSLPPWTRLLRVCSPEERLLERLELDGQVVYDVGAFTGAYSMFFSRRVGEGGRVVAFEPKAESFASLVVNLEHNHIRNVLPLHLALGERDGERAIYMLPGMPTTASIAPEANTPLRRKCGQTRVQCLDALVQSVPLPPPRLIKVDVEGLEMEVLRGALRTLGRSRPDLLVEVHGENARQKIDRIGQLGALLQPLGYSLLHAESGLMLGAARSSGQISSGHIFAHAA